MKYILGLYFWPMLVLATIFWFCMVAMAKLVESLVPSQRGLLMHEAACLWGCTIFILFPFWRLTIEGRENLPRDKKSYVIVANHLSAGDIFTLFCMRVQFRWLAKSDVFKVPLIGQAMTWAGYIPVDRGQKSSHERAMRASKEWLEKGVSMLFFPEGTRSKTGIMAPFKSGAFRLADSSKVDILPVALSGTYKMVRKFFPYPSKVVIHVFPPMRRSDTETLDAFTDRVRDTIAAGVTL